MLYCPIAGLSKASSCSVRLKVLQSQSLSFLKNGLNIFTNAQASSRWRVLEEPMPDP